MNLTKPHTLIMAPEGVEPGVKKGLPSITIGEKADRLSLESYPVKLTVVDLSVYYKQFKALDKVSIDIPENKNTPL
jgi:hypothetical protein